MSSSKRYKTASATIDRDKTYPLSRTLNFATKGEPKTEVKAFIDWTISKEGQAIVNKAGYTSIAAPEGAVVAVPTDKK